MRELMQRRYDQKRILARFSVMHSLNMLHVLNMYPVLNALHVLFVSHPISRQLPRPSATERLRVHWGDWPPRGAQTGEGGKGEQLTNKRNSSETLSRNWLFVCFPQEDSPLLVSCAPNVFMGF